MRLCNNLFPLMAVVAAVLEWAQHRPHRLCKHCNLYPNFHQWFGPYTFYDEGSRRAWNFPANNPTNSGMVHCNSFSLIQVLVLVPVVVVLEEMEGLEAMVEDSKYPRH
jgi:hypothetical protein